MTIGELFSAPVERIAAGGAGVLSFRGKRVFMDLAVPGDIVAGRISRDFPNWARAELVAVESPSPLRVEPRCPLAGICGGCSLQGLAYEAQVAEKTLILRDAFDRLGNIPLPETLPFIASAPWEYRNRVQLHRNSLGGAPGFKARRSGAIVPVSDCPVADPGIRAALREAAALPGPASDRFTLYARGDTLLSEGILRGKTLRRCVVLLRGR
jgi:23S rRNA (uracil1939-C5)-methyltransferase